MIDKLRKNTQSVDFDIIVGASSSINGDIQSGGSIRIDGKVVGNITAEGEAIIGKDASVTGNVRASQIELSGQVEGNIHSDGLLKIYASGILRGDIEVMSFVIDEGGAFEGLCNINVNRLPEPIALTDGSADLKNSENLGLPSEDTEIQADFEVDDETFVNDTEDNQNKSA